MATRASPALPVGALATSVCLSLCLCVPLCLATPAAVAGATGRKAAAHLDATEHRHRPEHRATVTAEGGPAPDGIGPLDAVACTAPRTCWAVSAEPSATPVAPAASSTTTTTSPAASTPAADAAAPGAVVDIAATDDAGASWTLQSAVVSAPVGLYGLSCPDAEHCMAVGSTTGTTPTGVVLVTRDAGRLWTSIPAPADAAVVDAVTCPGPVACIVIATSGGSMWSASTADDGTVWQRGATLPAGFAGATHLRCTDPLDCLSAGYAVTSPGEGAGEVVTTTNGGATWLASAVPEGTGILRDAWCDTDGMCVAVGTASTRTLVQSRAAGTVLESSDFGLAWSRRTAPSVVGAAVVCPASSSCVDAGAVWSSATVPIPAGGVAATTDGGASWYLADARYLPVGLEDVSCTTARLCVAVGGDLVARISVPGPDASRPPAGTG